MQHRAALVEGPGRQRAVGAMRDRAVLAREVEDSVIENTHQVLLPNAPEAARTRTTFVVPR